MSFIFFSHASEDKVDLVRPLVEAMLMEGEAVWLDRPGAGDNNFGFTQAFISQHDIDHLQSGNPWSTSIQRALRESGAVVGCLSRALLGKREVLEGELTVADTVGKLVTCIVDGLPHKDLPKFSHGLLDLSKHQTMIIVPSILRHALKMREMMTVEQMPDTEKNEWEKVRNLIGSINRVRREPRKMSHADVTKIVPALSRVPIGPIFKISEVPEDVLFTFGDHLNTPDRSRALLKEANILMAAATEDVKVRPLMRIREGALPPVGSTSGDNYWTQVFHVAGLVARRAVAALIMAPTAKWALTQSRREEDAHILMEKLLQH